MIDFKKNPKLGIFTYGILLLSCLLEISVELGLHEFDDFASHHGLAIFAVGSLFANWDELTTALENLKKSKNEQKWAKMSKNEQKWAKIAKKWQKMNEMWKSFLKSIRQMRHIWKKEPWAIL